MTSYQSEKAKAHALGVINNGYAATVLLQKQMTAIYKELDKIRLDFVHIRSAVYGQGKGKTGRVGARRKTK